MTGSARSPLLPLLMLAAIAAASAPQSAAQDSAQRPDATEPCPEAISGKEFAPGEWVGILILDATGDGIPDVFVADTDRGGNAGEPWSLYRRTAGGESVVVDSVFFHPLGFRLVGTRLETYWRSNAGSGRFITYRISDDAILEIEKTEILSSEDPEYESRWQAMIEWRPHLEGAWYSARRSADGELECRSRS